MKNDGDAPQSPLAEELHALRAEVAQLNAHRFVRIHNSIPRLLMFNLARGLAFGLGTVLGASVLLSLVAWALSQVEFLPIIGEWVSEILRQIEASVE
ncbi:hypothetical protein BXY70_2536 [Roseovarius halotolerans]|uniref:Uncharacterized protein n=1 Tax=Roseovarius halotolerans TaxID=505353 RepID=A0A1X6ZAY1_9RHOB|nr:DUF5665 domain-containing protein [Roseovarius halotolerans]RKT30546.1 hypothetical protein BXY70_2536 [Roseovarius halotolerans]SLN45785.1 hypothetical protein ROH8110_02433 [Roseovarius halotolerans]